MENQMTGNQATSVQDYSQRQSVVSPATKYKLSLVRETWVCSILVSGTQTRRKIVFIIFTLCTDTKVLIV